MLQSIVTGVSLGAGVICFGLYVWQTIKAILVKPAGPDAKAMTLNDISKLVDSLTKLTEALTKAGPALTSLIASILFFAVAAVSSGVLHTGQ